MTHGVIQKLYTYPAEYWTIKRKYTKWRTPDTGTYIWTCCCWVLFAQTKPQHGKDSLENYPQSQKPNSPVDLKEPRTINRSVRGIYSVSKRTPKLIWTAWTFCDKFRVFSQFTVEVEKPQDSEGSDISKASLYQVVSQQTGTETTCARTHARMLLTHACMHFIRTHRCTHCFFS